VNTAAAVVGKTSADPSATALTPQRPPRRRRRLLVTCALLMIVVVFHGPLFGCLAGFLVVDDPLQPMDAVVVMGRSGPYRSVPFDELADWYHQRLAREVVLIEDRSSRIVEAGIVPTLETILRRELVARGVPDKALTTLVVEDGAAWNGVRSLRDWLERRPPARVTILCSQFEGRQSAHVVRTVLGDELAQRVRWHALPEPRFNGSNWWHSRQGIVEMCGAHVSLFHTYLFGEEESAPRWNPDQYEQSLAAPTAR
jgi:hypothetical protein